MTKVRSGLTRLAAAAFVLLCFLMGVAEGGAQPNTPAAPTIESVRADDGALAVIWSPPAGATDAVIAYDIQYKRSGTGGSWTVLDDAWTVGSLEYGITSLTNGASYDVQVRAVNANGDGAWSATTSGTPADFGDSLSAATEVVLGAASEALPSQTSLRYWGKIESAGDEDYFKLVLTDTQAPTSVGLWVYARGELDTVGDPNTVGELQDENGVPIGDYYFGEFSSNPVKFSVWKTVDAGTYYVKISDRFPNPDLFSSEKGDYVVWVNTAAETTSRQDALDLPLGGAANGIIDTAGDQDYFRLLLPQTTDVILGMSDKQAPVGELLTESGAVIERNEEGSPEPRAGRFMIRRTLSSGTYYLRVIGAQDSDWGEYSVYATAVVDPGDTRATAAPLALGSTGGGDMTSHDDVDYFRLELAESAYVGIWSARQPGNVDTDGVLLDGSGNEVSNANVLDPELARVGFGIEGYLTAGAYYVKVTRDQNSRNGKYVIQATEYALNTVLVEDCSAIGRNSGIGDTLYGCQWHLNNDDQFPFGVGEDVNVEGVWSDGVLGEGITVAVVDDGMQHQHEDLRDNVDSSRNHDYTGSGDIYDPFGFHHGTPVAGIIAARDNSIGMRGVAPRATIYGYNLIHDERHHTHANEADAMSRNAGSTAISNNSWGPGDSAAPERAHALWEEAVKNGVTAGYGGKGVFYAWAAGNGADLQDNSNLDEYANFYAVTAVCAVDHTDLRTQYSEQGSNLWVCAPSGDSIIGRPDIATTDDGNWYTTRFDGTSAATPMVSGVAALARQVNNELTWRDVKLILAASARQNDATFGGWEEGATKYRDAGSNYNFSHHFGFGVVDAGAAVDLARNWTNVPPLRKSTAESARINLSIPDAAADPMENIVVPGTTVTSTLALDSHVAFIEYIQVDTHFDHGSFRDLETELISPAGNVSVLVPRLEIDPSYPRVPDHPLTEEFRLGSAKHLGESAEGAWTLRITDHRAETAGTLKSWSITAYGHGEKPLAPDPHDVHPASGGYTLIWKAPTDTGRADISSYDVRHIKTSEDETVDSNWTVVDGAWTSGDLQYTAGGLSAGERYDVQVRAGNAHGDSPWSDTITVTPTAADAPTVEIVTPGNGTLTVAWSAPTNTSLGTITSYDLRYGLGASPSSWTTVDSVWTSGSLEYTINPPTALRNGSIYGVQVRAVVGSDEKSWSNTRTGTPRTFPGTPTVTGLESNDGQLVAKWNRPSSNGGADITSYDLRYIETGEDKTVGANWTEEIGAWSSGSGRREYTILGVENWATYDVQVRAVNDAGAGDWSATQTGTPTNTDVKVHLEWESTRVDVNEPAGRVTLTALATTDRDSALPDDFFFDFTVTTVDGTAAEPGDYSAASESAAFTDSDFTRMEVDGRQRYRATQEFTVSIINDAEDEYDENFTAALAYAYAGISNLQTRSATATVTIRDDEYGPVTLGWLNDAFSVNEAAGTATIRATSTTTEDKRPETGFSFQATVSTSAGSAAAGADYTNVSTRVTFERRDFSSTAVNGDRRWRATKSISVPITDDDADEFDETFTATVDYVNSSPPHLQGGSADTTVTIVDNDPPEVSIRTNDVGSGEDQTLRFTLTRVGILTDPLTVNVRVSETGRMLASGPPSSVTFTAGSGAADLDVALNDDTEDEENSVVTVAVRSGSGYALGDPSSATATAVDNDHVPVTLRWDRTSITVAERAGRATLRAVAATTKDKRPESGFTFNAEATYADGTAGSTDYTPGSTSVNFQESDFARSGSRYAATKDLTVSIVSGDGDEGNETFTAALAYADDSLPYLTGGGSIATVTIVESDDPLVTITADDRVVTEAEDSIAFTLTRDGDAAASLRVNVDVTETGGNMLARSGRYTLNFAADSNTASLEVNLQDDAQDEDDSEVTAEVVNGSGYFAGSDSVASVTVDDDDHVPVTLEWEETTLTVVEGSASATLIAVATTARDKAPEDGFDFDATLTLSDGSATEGEDYSPSSSTTQSFAAGNFRQETINGQSRYRATGTFFVTIEPDDDHEPDENFTAHLAWETPGEPHLLGGNSTVRVTITDDDPVPLALGWERPQWSAEEDDGSVTLKAVAITSINRMPEEGFSFDAAVSTSSVNTSGGGATPGTDFTGLSVTETFLRSDFRRATFDGRSRYRAEKEFTITIGDDGIDESNEDFSVRLAYDQTYHPNLAAGITEATVWIIEDDTDTADVQLTRNSSPGSVSQGATLTYEYTVRNDGPATATDLQLVVYLDPHVSVDTADLSSVCSHSVEATGGMVNCSLGNLGDGGNEDIRIEVTVESVPSDGIINRAHVTGSQADPTPGNNTYPAATGGGTTPPRPPPITGGGGPVNRAPVFVDAEGDAIAETSRAIAEDAAPGANIGEPVAATDPEEDTLTYTLGGDDAASFAIDPSTGQLTTATALDHETQASYSVTVIATDPSGATAEIGVTITITEVVVFDCASGNAVSDAAGNPGLVADCEALLRSRDRLAGDASLNWSEDTPITEWDGVRLGGTPQRVTRLYLVQKSLGGTIPADLGSLSRLTGLYLHHNELTGPIPSQLGDLSSLVHLTLHRNRLVGEIPAALGDLTALTFLSLYGNNLTGELPAELGSLSNLRWLYVHSNKSGDGGGLSGAIPAAFGDLRSLERLLLYGNSLSGAIPPELGRLPNLKSLLLHDNELSGRIPAELGDLSSLRYLWLDDNELTGRIPSELGDLSSLRWLSLYGNNLSGAIPAELGDLSGLRLLILDRNDLSGAIPARLGELSELTWLDLNDNDLSGTIPSSLGDLSNLVHLYLHNNDLTGAVPADLGRLTNLTNLWLRDNRLSGRIPASLGELPNLQRVRISGNAFTGCVPDGLLGETRWYSDAEELGLPACGG